MKDTIPTDGEEPTIATENSEESGDENVCILGYGYLILFFIFYLF